MLLITACQQEEKPVAAQNQQEQKEATAKTAIEKTEAKVETVVESHDDSHSHHGHDHGAAPTSDTPLVMTGERFKMVEPQEECSEPVVIEFYAYHCPHCKDLEPAAEAWRKKNAGKVKFISVPSDLGHQQMGSLLLVHHAAKILGVLEKTQHALFNRFHVEKKLFSSADEAAQFLADQGADLEKAKLVLADQEAMSKSINPDFELLNKYRIASVPQVLVNHQYITDITSAGGHKEVFETVDEMLKLQHNCKVK